MSRPQSEAPSWLSSRQEELYSALCGYGSHLGPIYAGGLRVLEDDSNPDRLAQSAHSMRELMEKFTEQPQTQIRTAGTATAQMVPLKAKVIEVEDLFRSGTGRTSCHSDSRWSGEIDDHLRKLLAGLDRFFHWFAEVHPRRRELFERTMSQRDHTGRRLSARLKRGSWEAWNEIRSYFVAVSHHRKPTDPKTLERQIAELETFLADLLLTGTAEEWDAIDDLLEEALDA